MPRVVIGLNAVVTALRDAEPHVLCVRRGALKTEGRDGGGDGGEAEPGGETALPYGPFEPDAHRTFDLGMRALIEGQTAQTPALVEQLYTFGDEGREVTRARLDGGDASDRIVSVGYLALMREAGGTGGTGAGWLPWYDLFPYEDRRGGAPLPEALTAALAAWAGAAPERRARTDLAFGLTGVWEEERALDRYELLYEAGLVEEARRDGRASAPLPQTGPPMTSDHRRILATAIGRLRGKLRYRPVVFELMADAFTLSELQAATESLLGFCVHKQNFRRAVTRSGLVAETGGTRAGPGRPAALFRRAGGAGVEGLTLPRLRTD